MLQITNTVRQFIAKPEGNGIMSSVGPRKIGFCILTYNSERFVLHCIRSIIATISNIPYEIVVVDNDSHDGCVDVVRREYPEIPLISTGKNLGYSAGNNVGGKYLLGRNCEYIAFINPDVILGPDTIAQMLQVLSENPRAGCVGGIPTDQGAMFAGSFRTKPTVMQKVLLQGIAQYLPVIRRFLRPLVERLRARHYMPLQSVKKGQTVCAVSGGCIVFPAAAFAQIGGFDDQTFLFQEEFIISERLRRHGYQVVAAPDAIYEHAWGHSQRSRPLVSLWHYIRSEQQLVRNYYGWGLLGSYALLLFRYSELTAYAFVVLLKRFIGRPPSSARDPQSTTVP